LVYWYRSQRAKLGSVPRPAFWRWAEVLGVTDRANQVGRAERGASRLRSTAVGPRHRGSKRATRRLERAGLTRADFEAVVWRLIRRWLAFDPTHRRVLAIGIYKAILLELPDVSPVALSALHGWCSHPAYLCALAKRSGGLR
jgi:hypothetical protein